MSWGMHTYTLLDRIHEIERAMECSLWQSALAMALTIPDICGQIEFYDKVRVDKKGVVILDSNGEPIRLVGEQYKAWFTKYVEQFYADSSGFNEDWTAKQPYFTAVMCWQLRNAFLHSGSDNIDTYNTNQTYNFQLQVNASDSISKVNDEKIDVTVDVGNLCHNICNAGKKFYDNWEKREDFSDKCFEWLDLNEWSKCFHEYNT